MITRDNNVIALRAEGKSIDTIAKELGINRNIVSGVLFRYGRHLLTGRKGPKRSAKFGPRKSRKSRLAVTPAPAIAEAQKPEKSPSPVVSTDSLPPEETPLSGLPEPTPGYYLTDLPPGGCRFEITKDVPVEGYRFCGKPGFPWCTEHVKKVYNIGFNKKPIYRIGRMG